MLRSRLTDSVNSSNVTAILHSSEARKILVAKDNGDIEVYYREHDKLKLYQAYPKLLQSSQTEETHIYGLYEAYELSTVFARCEKSLLLFNSTNLHQYDQIIDRRGISNCWIFELSLPSCEEKNTFLIYSTKGMGKLRMLIWEGRIYKKLVEASLSNDKEVVQSALPGKRGIILATNLGIYHWSYGESLLSRIDKIVKRKYPNDMVRSLGELKSMCHSKGEKNESANDAHSFVSNSRITKKSSILNFWARESHQKSQLRSLRYIFSPSPDEYLLLDGMTNNLFEFGLTDSQLPYMIASDLSQFVEWNGSFSHVQYLSLNLLILYNDKMIRFVDYQNGFTFLQQEVMGGIKVVEKIDECYFIVLNTKNQLQLFQYKVDDNSEDNFDDDESICGVFYDSDFYQLWRKVLFYGFFLASPSALQLCSSDNQELSLDVCALKLRDLTVMWCLEIFERFQSYMAFLSQHDRVDLYCLKLQSIIVESIFDKLIEFWAPPQLVILKTFPMRIARLVFEITGQEHNCVLNGQGTQKISEIPAELLRKWFLPYLVDTRRHLKSMTNDDKIIWEHSGRKIKVGIDFFLIDNHGTLNVSTLLTLIDTVLFLTYLYYFPTMVTPLLSVDNLCDYDTVIEELSDRHMFQELVCFYFQRKKHSEALDFLTNLSKDLDGRQDNQQLQDGVKFLVIDYLKKLTKDYQELIFHYTDWLLERFHPGTEILESIFINDAPIYANRDHYEIYQYIDRHDPQVSLEYLEIAISAFKVQDIRLHTTLIKRYFENLSDMKTRIKVKSVLETTSAYEPRTVLRLLEDTSDELNGSLAEDDIRFLEYLKIYPLQKLGNFKQAVDILFESLSDYNSTSLFCEKVYSSNNEQGRDILTYFFKKIIKSTTGDKNPHIAYFIQEHGSKLNSVDIYKLLPANLLLSDVKQVLLQTIKSHSIEKDQTRIKKGLLQVELINKTNELNKSLSRYVMLDEGYKCPVCKKSFSTFITDTALWFKLENRDVVVHYTCGKTLEAKMESKSIKARTRENRVVADLKGNE